MFARPLNVRVLADLQKQIKLLSEKRIVILEFQSEERKRFDERTPPGDDLRSSVRKQIKRRETPGTRAPGRLRLVP